MSLRTPVGPCSRLRLPCRPSICTEHAAWCILTGAYHRMHRELAGLQRQHMLAPQRQSLWIPRPPTITTHTQSVRQLDGCLLWHNHFSVLGTLQALDLSRQQDDLQHSRRVMQSLEVDLDAVSRDVHQLQQEGSVNTARGDVRKVCGHDVSLKGFLCCILLPATAACAGLLKKPRPVFDQQQLFLESLCSNEAAPDACR